MLTRDTLCIRYRQWLCGRAAHETNKESSSSRGMARDGLSTIDTAAQVAHCGLNAWFQLLFKLKGMNFGLASRATPTATWVSVNQVPPL